MVAEIALPLLNTFNVSPELTTLPVATSPALTVVTAAKDGCTAAKDNATTCVRSVSLVFSGIPPLGLASSDATTHAPFTELQIRLYVLFIINLKRKLV